MRCSWRVATSALALIVAGCGDDDNGSGPPPVSVVPPPAPAPPPPPAPTPPPPAPTPPPPPTFSFYPKIDTGEPYRSTGFGISETVVRDAADAIVRVDIAESDVTVNFKGQSAYDLSFGPTDFSFVLGPAPAPRVVFSNPFGILQIGEFDWTGSTTWYRQGQFYRFAIFGSQTKSADVIREGFRVYNGGANLSGGAPASGDTLGLDGETLVDMRTGEVTGYLRRRFDPVRYLLAGTVTDFGQATLITIRDPAGVTVGSMTARFYGPDATRLSATIRMTIDGRERPGLAGGTSSERLPYKPTLF